MPAPLAVDKEQVRMLVLSIGVREAARQCGIAEGTVQDWSAKGKWLAPTRPIPAQLPPPAYPTNPTIRPADALAGCIAEDGKLTKVAGMRYAKRTVEYAAKLAETSPEKALAMSGDVKSALQGAAISGDWSSATAGGTSVNILIQ